MSFQSASFRNSLLSMHSGAWGRVMPINRLIRDGEIEAQEVERLNRAFTFTLQSLSLVDRDDPLCEMVARKIIEIDALGTHDPAEIVRIAAAEFGIQE
jgi:hypothetical protein